MVSQTRGHHDCYCSQWSDQQRELSKVVGIATGFKVGRCWHVQILELFTIEQCDQAVMDFLVATEVGKFSPK